jgi:hypothetical protein
MADQDEHNVVSPVPPPPAKLADGLRAWWAESSPLLKICAGGLLAMVVIVFLLKVAFPPLAQSMSDLKSKLGVSDPAFWAGFWTVVGCTVLVLLAVVVAISKPDGKLAEAGFLLILIVSGAAIGSLLGTYLSPQNALERDTFGGFKTAIAGVLSGYFLSKFQRIFDKVVDDSSTFNLNLLIRTLFFMTALILVTNGVYSTREYKNQSILIASRSEIASMSNAGTDMRTLQEKPINLQPGEQTRFAAEANFPQDSSVSWSIDDPAQIVDPKNPHGTTALQPGKIGLDGSFTAPEDIKCAPCFVVVAISNQDKSKLARRNVNIGQKVESSPSGTSTSNTTKSGAAAPVIKPPEHVVAAPTK